MSSSDHDFERLEVNTGEQITKATDTEQMSFDQIHQTLDEQITEQTKETEDNQRSEETGADNEKLTSAKCAEPAEEHNLDSYCVPRTDGISQQCDPKPNEHGIGKNEKHQGEQTNGGVLQDGQWLKQSYLNRLAEGQIMNKCDKKSDRQESRQGDKDEGKHVLNQSEINTAQMSNKSDTNQEHQTLNQSDENSDTPMPNITDPNQGDNNDIPYLYSALFKPYGHPNALYEHEQSEEGSAIHYEDEMHDEFEADEDTATPFILVYFTNRGDGNDLDQTMEADNDMIADIDIRTANATRLPDIDLGTTKYRDDVTISGMVFIPPNFLAALDSDNDEMKVIDVFKNKLAAQIKFPDTPWDIAVINDELAVTMPLFNAIALFSLKTVASLNKGRIPIRYLAVEGQCYGIAAIESNIVTAFPDQKKVEIIDLEGNVLVSIMGDFGMLFRRPSYVAVSKEEFGEFIYVSDDLKNVVTKISKSGEVIEKYRHKRWDRILGLACVGDSLLVVNQWGVKEADKKSKGISSDTDDDDDDDEYPTVDIVSDGGQVITTLLDESHGLKLPRALCYIEQMGRLYVSGEFSTDTKLRSFSITKQREQMPDTSDQTTDSNVTKQSEQVPKHQEHQTSNQSQENPYKSTPNITDANQNEQNKVDSETEYEEERYDDFQTDEDVPTPFGNFTVLGKVDDRDQMIEADNDMSAGIDIRTANVTSLPDIDLGTATYIDKVHISGMVFIPPKSLAVVDSENDQMKVIDLLTNKLAAQHAFPSQPWDITVINDELAVTLPLFNAIALISLQAKASLNQGRIPIRYLAVEGQCYGIATIESNFVVAFQDSAKVEIIDLEGNVLVSIIMRDYEMLFWRPTYVAVSKEEFGGFIYVSDNEGNVVTKISKSGEVIEKYRHTRWDRILGLDCVGDSLLVVNQWGVKEADKKSKGIDSDTDDDDDDDEYPTVDIVSDGGQVITTLLDESNGLILPKTLCYIEHLGRLYVSGKFSTGSPLMAFSITKQSEQMPDSSDQTSDSSVKKQSEQVPNRNDQMTDSSVMKQSKQVPDTNDKMVDVSVTKQSEQTSGKIDQTEDEQGIEGGERNPDIDESDQSELPGDRTEDGTDHTRPNEFISQQFGPNVDDGNAPDKKDTSLEEHTPVRSHTNQDL